MKQDLQIFGLIRKEEEKKRIIGDMYPEKSLFVLVTPIDSAAPKGRLILPQQQTIRDILDGNGSVMMVKEDGLEKALAVNPSLSSFWELKILIEYVYSSVAILSPGENKDDKKEK